jgi:BirA family transcriptional regulator, biotin operon repressor / biotin---[acetyl-CoA-carboxylase] ligase
MPELSTEAIARARRSARLGRPVIFFERVGSTNDVACRQAAAGAAEGLLVVADKQTAGRGRMGRSWWAPKAASLLFSLLLRPAIPPARAGQLTMCLGLGAVEGIERVTGLHPTLKWPNDLLLDGRKLGGMLAELRATGDRVEFAVLGLGLNVNAAPPDLAETSICLATVLGRAVDRVELLAEILARCEAWYERLLATQAGRPSSKPDAERWKPDAAEPISTAWSARLDTLGREVTVGFAGGQLHGRAVGITPEGALLLEQEDGQIHVVWGGDVMLHVPRLGGSPHAVL